MTTKSTLENEKNNDPEIKEQLSQCLILLKNVFRQELLGVYLFGSLIMGRLQKYSDIDIFVIAGRPTTYDERAKLVANLLKISGVYQQSSKLPIEMTIVVKSEINPWHYPPKFDFQYGDWLRKEFESGNIDPWRIKEMPDLALIITQILLASKTLLGSNPNQLICKVPYQDFITATNHILKDLLLNLNNDTRNVLLTYGRIWSTVETDSIRSKPSAADWVIDRLPEKYKIVMERAKSICLGEDNEYWDDIKSLIQPCVDFMLSHINKKIASIALSDYANKCIKLAE